MTKVHRTLLSRYAAPTAINLDAPYGFQENVEQMSQKLAEYFDVSLQQVLTTPSFTSLAIASALDQERLRLAIRQADYIFSGPGSPSYAVEQWRPAGVGNELRNAVEQGATLCFASAAALTLGTHTAPIYEIYKAGAAPYWLEGLDVMSVLGLRCVVIPHFDNAEGSNYDTSCCYLGQRRLELMELDLPADVAVLGIDEHTAAIFDAETLTLRVEGRGGVHWRTNGEQLDIAAGRELPIGELPASFTPREPSVSGPALPNATNELAEVALSGGQAALSAIAELARLAESGGQGRIDPSDLINNVLAARVAAREAKQYELADRLRDALVNAGIQINDGPSGTSWTL
jgi:hypothetical protein